MKKLFLITLVLFSLFFVACEGLIPTGDPKDLDTKSTQGIDTIPMPNYWSRCDSWVNLTAADKTDFSLTTDVFGDGSGSLTHGNVSNGVFGNAITNIISLSSGTTNYIRRYDTISILLNANGIVNKQGTVMFWARSVINNQDSINYNPYTELKLTLTSSNSKSTSYQLTTYDNYSQRILGDNEGSEYFASDNNWHLYITTWDLDGFESNGYYMAIYVDGVYRDGIKALPAGMVDFETLSLRFGSLASNTVGNGCSLYIDNIMFWDKVLPVDAIASNDDLVEYFYNQKLEYRPEWF